MAEANIDIYKELLDPSNSLLERFKETAPGSSKHCINVEAMCDAICSELPELDKNLLRLAARFHDVGKMFNPEYFIENQKGEENPHDKLDPFISYQLITRHVSDGAAILVQHNFPLPVIDVVLQHHGNSVMYFFFHKSKSSAEENFRYKFKPPQTIEAAVLMIVDIVESTARSLYSNGKLNDSKTRKKVVEDTVDRLQIDGQIDNIKVGVLRIVKKILPRELDSFYHDRIDYPEQKNILAPSNHVET
jgi:hypothetical protein